MSGELGEAQTIRKLLGSHRLIGSDEEEKESVELLQNLVREDGEHLTIHWGSPQSDYNSASEYYGEIFNRVLEFSTSIPKVQLRGLWIQSNADFYPCPRNIACERVLVQVAKNPVVLRNCYIYSLLADDVEPSETVLIRCWIGCLRLESTSTRQLTLNRTGILTLDVPPNYQPNPFIGGLQITKLWLPSKRYDHRHALEGAQPWANMRHHVQALGNPEATKLFHRTEMRIEALQAGAVTRAFDTLYRVSCDYGRSINAPIFWLITLWLAAFLAYWICHGAVPTDACRITIWSRVLCEFDSRRLPRREMVQSEMKRRQPLEIDIAREIRKVGIPFMPPAATDIVDG